MEALATKQAIPEFTIGLKYKSKKSQLRTVSGSKDAADVCRMCFEDGKLDWVEEFVVIALNRANKVLGFYKISSGGVSGTVADPKVIFQFALLSNASAIIISHNHPSGNVKPSTADLALTKKIKGAADYLDISVLDHIIVTDESHFSFADEGIL